MKKVLVISSHIDDADLSIGGTLSKHVNKMDKVFHIVLSKSEISNPSFDTEKEWHKAQDELGIRQRMMFNFKTRSFAEQSKEITQSIYDLKGIFKPDIVYTHTSFDNHQDHKVTHEACIRIFKNCDVFGYPLDWNSNRSNLNGFSIIYKKDLNKKIKALKNYKSQSHKNYFNEDYIRSKAIADGVKFGEMVEKSEIINKIFAV